MFIDGRGKSIEEVLTNMRDVVRTQCAGEADVEVLVETREFAIKVKGFATMSGCNVKVSKHPDGYTMRVTGGSCRCV